MRLIETITKGKNTTKVHYSREWQEYRVRLFVGGTAIPEADYFTSDRDDAYGTAELMLQGI